MSTPLSSWRKVKKKLPADERSDHERFDAESDDAIANDHGAHIAPDCPADHGPTHHRRVIR